MEYHMELLIASALLGYWYINGEINSSMKTY